MLLVVQFPFADMRGFLPNTVGRLSRPAWPIPEIGKDFIRSSGVIRRRRRGGAREWAGEEIHGDVAKVLRFQRRAGRQISADSRPCGKIAYLFQRYFSD